MGKMGKNLVLSNKSGLPLAVPFDFIYNEILVGLKMKFFVNYLIAPRPTWDDCR